MNARRAFRPVLALALLLQPAAVQAAPAVFADPLGVNNGEVEISETPGQSLELYLELGTVDSGNACREGSSGDEICGYHVELRVDGTGFIESFAAASGVRSWPTDFSSGNVRDLSVAFVIDATTADPASMTPDPVHIGTLSVDGTGGARVLVEGVAAIDAGLTEHVIPSDTIATTIPEPGAVLQLLCGLAGVALLQRRRRRARESLV